MKTLLAAHADHARTTGDPVAFSWLEGDCTDPVQSITHAQLHQQAVALATNLRHLAPPGSRILLPFPPGLDFIVAFLGCLHAGLLPVPAPFPQNRRTTARTVAIFADCDPALVLIPERWQTAIANRLGPSPATIRGLEPLLAADATSPECSAVDPNTIAYLQYTSGTGGTTKGVKVSYANLAHNIAVHQSAVHQPADRVMLSWLPQYHDMQLVGIICRTLTIGGHCMLMSPIDFLQRPLRWLRAVSAHRAYLSGGPNFAYENCVQRIGSDELGDLDLSLWRIAFNSSERIRPGTVRAFGEKFAPCGFDPKAFYAAYGLAEATALVTGTVVGHGITFREHPAANQPIASCGRPVPADHIRVVDPVSASVLAPEAIGEICVTGRAITSGYWGAGDGKRISFHPHLPDETPPGPWLRTGDLGFIDAAGCLHLTGRLKDLIIIRGTNHLPEDIEMSVDRAHPTLRAGNAAAFALEIPTASHERLAIAVELERVHRHRPDVDAIAEAVQIVLSQDHGLALDDLFLLPPGGLSKTTSGKVQRRLCCEQLISGALSTIAEWHRDTPLSASQSSESDFPHRPPPTKSSR